MRTGPSPACEAGPGGGFTGPTPPFCPMSIPFHDTRHKRHRQEKTLTISGRKWWVTEEHPTTFLPEVAKPKELVLQHFPLLTKFGEGRFLALSFHQTLQTEVPGGRHGQKSHLPPAVRQMFWYLGCSNTGRAPVPWVRILPTMPTTGKEKFFFYYSRSSSWTKSYICI